VVPRGMRWVGRTMCRPRSDSGSLMSSRASSAAARPRSDGDWATVDRSSHSADELGLPEVEDLSETVLQDPIWERSGHTDRGRDGCRVPIPWSGQSAPFGFSPADASAEPWLPQPANWSKRSVQAQTGDETSMLELYRTALHLRREHPALGDGTLAWVEAPAGVLAFRATPVSCAWSTSRTSRTSYPNTPRPCWPAARSRTDFWNRTTRSGSKSEFAPGVTPLPIRQGLSGVTPR